MTPHRGRHLRCLTWATGEGAGRERRFGQLTEPSDDLLTYGSYLKIPELLSLQQLRSDPPVHDELLFIVVHQAYELWFKQLLFELESVRDRMFAGDAERARHYLVRVHAIERVLIEHIQVLQSMSPQDFLAFRTLLTPASGFQSVQFRELEFISGLKDERYLQDVAAEAEERARLERRLAEPTLWDGFCALLETSGYPMPADDADVRLDLARRDGARPSRAVRRERRAARSRRVVLGLAVPSRADGRTRDRRQAGNGRIERRGLPALDARQAVLPRAVGLARICNTLVPGRSSRGYPWHGRTHRSRSR